LLKKEKFQRNAEALAALKNIKKLVAKLPILTVLDFSKMFLVETEESNIGLGMVLMQEGSGFPQSNLSAI